MARTIKCTIVLCLISACTILLSSQTHASAWNQPEGNGQFILNGWYYQTEHYFDNSGNLHRQPEYSKYDFNPYVEYGLTPDWTIGTNLTLADVHQNASPGAPAQNNFGLGDSEFFARYRIWQQNGFVLSAQPLVKLPSIESSTAEPRLGGSSPDVALSLLGGYGFDAYGQHHFVDLEGGYRHRFGNPTDQIQLSGTLGIGLTQSLTLMPQLFATYRTSSPSTTIFTNSPAGDYNLVTGQLSLVYKLNSLTSFQLGGYDELTAKNTGSGGGVLVSIWRNF